MSDPFETWFDDYWEQPLSVPALNNAFKEVASKGWDAAISAMKKKVIAKGTDLCPIELLVVLNQLKNSFEENIDEKAGDYPQDWRD